MERELMESPRNKNQAKDSGRARRKTVGRREEASEKGGFMAACFGKCWPSQNEKEGSSGILTLVLAS